MKRHALDMVSLTAGLLTVGTAVVLMVDADVGTLWQYAPLALVALGLALLGSAVTGTRRRTAAGGAEDVTARDHGSLEPHDRRDDTLRVPADDLDWPEPYHGDDPGRAATEPEQLGGTRRVGDVTGPMDDSDGPSRT